MNNLLFVLQAAKEDQMVDPLGAIPIESVMTVSSLSNKSEVHLNGDASHESSYGEFF